jgi:glycosyltransferase involved in cell wall biosynthesis
MPQDEIVKRLADCDLIVLAYDERTDSASGAVRVALSSLAPVAVTRVGIFQELEDAVGWLPSNDPQAMAPAIADLLLDQDRRRAIQARATAWLQAHDWALVAARLEGMIHGLVAADRLERAMGSAGLLAAVEP